MSQSSSSQTQPQQQSKSMMGYFWAAREYVTPTLSTSQFIKKGLLTPEEFIKAGDELIFRCPTWTWDYCRTDPSKNKSYLPPTKQYLITRNIPCPHRVAFYENSNKHHQSNTNALDVMDDDGDWLLSNMIHSQELIEQQKNIHTEQTTIAEDDDEFDIIDEDGEVVSKKPMGSDIRKEQEQLETGTAEESLSSIKPTATAATTSNNDYEDMDAYDDDNVYMDDDVADTATATTATLSSSMIRNVRTYNLSITYDKYYQTPRIWMSGKYNDQYLTGKEMLEDVISDYANRTVTIEQHPFILGPHASIHPCKHGAVMKTIVSNLIQATKEKSQGTTNQDDSAELQQPPISVEMYLFIFLKFVSSIIPTMNYDFTMDVTADVQKK